MPRDRRPLRLSLLLAVAPLVAACGEAEGRHCVGPDGVYLADDCCEAHAACHVAGAHTVYVPHRYYSGTGTHAGSWASRTSPSRGSSAGISRGGFGSHGGGGHAGGE